MWDEAVGGSGVGGRVVKLLRVAARWMPAGGSAGAILSGVCESQIAGL